MSAPDRDPLRARLERVLDLAERLLQTRVPAERELPDGEVLAYRWRHGALEPITHLDLYPLEGLIGVERSVARLRANFTAFAGGQPALDTLIYGERGTGKSSAVRGLLGEFATKGLRLVEVRPDDLFDLPGIFRSLRSRTEKFALFCDDLSFEAGDTSYKELKAALEGGIEARPANTVIVATSNRRYLIPERIEENLEARVDAAGELHPGETTEEKLSLSDRFGLLLPFFAFDQQTFLRIVDYHAHALGLEGRLSTHELHARALRFALERSSRSGRTARQACVLILQQLAESSA